MTDKQELKETLKLGTVAQVGCVVRNVSETIRNYEEIIGIGPFMTLDFKPEKGFIKGRRSDDMVLKIGIAQLTPELSLELIEVVTGDPYHKDFLEKHGEGVQHLGFITYDYDGVLARAEKLNIPVLMWAETDVPGMGHVRAAYLDTYEKVGVLFEVIEVTPP
ncbi:MAG: VOC family protein [Deltaproteobacteria bacterium]|nr:VOC family protein [Deltaproteobacteria bacterium]